MKCIMLLCAALALAVAFGQAVPPIPKERPAPRPKYTDPKIFIGKPAPEAMLISSQGTGSSVSAMKGGIGLLVFAMSWVEPTCMDFDVLQRLQTKYAAKGLRIAMVTPEDTLIIGDWLEKNKYAFPVFCDTEGKAREAYLATTCPTVVVIGRDGKISDYIVQPRTPNEIFRALAKAGLKMQ